MHYMILGNALLDIRKCNTQYQEMQYSILGNAILDIKKCIT